ncbi:MAG: DUF433 domain-containing protein [Planctomycetota bacterium]
MDWRDYIHRDPEILAGKPVFKGTRLSVQIILECLAAGWEPEKIFHEFPLTRPEHLRAAQAYAAEVMDLTKFVSAD